MSKPSVTVLIPAYNASRFIDATLTSISAQSCTDFRAIISVDESIDDTYSRCIAHAERDRRFGVYRQKRRLGYVGNCNFLLAQTATDFAMFAFHDDILAPNCIARLSAALAAAPSATLAYCDIELTEYNKEMRQVAFTALEGAMDSVNRGLIMLREPPGWWVPNRGLFRMDAARQVQGVKRHSAGEFTSDLPWLIHLSLLGEFIRVPETLCFKFLQKESLSRSWPYSAEQWLAVYASCMREIWRSNLGEDDKLALTEALLVHSRPRRGRYSWLPKPVRSAGKKMLPPILLRLLH